MKGKTLEETKREALQAVASGITPANIAAELDISLGTVYKWVAESGTLKNLKAARDAGVCEDYSAAEMTVAEVATRYDISTATVYKILTVHKVELHGRRQQVTAAETDTIIAMYNGGATLREIRSATGRSQYAIYNALGESATPIKFRHPRLPPTESNKLDEPTTSTTEPNKPTNAPNEANK